MQSRNARRYRTAHYVFAGPVRGQAVLVAGKVGLQAGWGLEGGGVAGRVRSWCYAGLGGGARWMGGWVD